jgi:hypothetical protein
MVAGTGCWCWLLVLVAGTGCWYWLLVLVDIPSAATDPAPLWRGAIDRLATQVSANWPRITTDLNGSAQNNVEA